MKFSGHGFKSYSDLLSITINNLSASGEYHNIANCGHWIAVPLTLKSNQVNYWEKNLSMMDKSWNSHWIRTIIWQGIEKILENKNVKF